MGEKAAKTWRKVFFQVGYTLKANVNYWQAFSSNERIARNLGCVYSFLLYYTLFNLCVHHGVNFKVAPLLWVIKQKHSLALTYLPTFGCNVVCILLVLYSFSLLYIILIKTIKQFSQMTGSCLKKWLCLVDGKDMCMSVCLP